MKDQPIRIVILAEVNSPADLVAALKAAAEPFKPTPPRPTAQETRGL